MKIYLSEFDKHMEYFKSINKSEIKDWEIYDENNEKIDIPEYNIKEFIFTGLSNRDFIGMRYWEDGWMIEKDSSKIFLNDKLKSIQEMSDEEYQQHKIDKDLLLEAICEENPVAKSLKTSIQQVKQIRNSKDNVESWVKFYKEAFLQKRS